jgi:hypothetical protein
MSTEHTTLMAHNALLDIYFLKEEMEIVDIMAGSTSVTALLSQRIYNRCVTKMLDFTCQPADQSTACQSTLEATPF